MSNHKDHFIPSPYKVVTAYENEFIRKWNKSLATAIDDVVKYLAKTASSEIKNIDKNETE